MDVHVLRAHGVRTVAALGGASAGSDLFERLAELHIEQAILAFDNDAAGRTATINAIDAATRAHHAPDLWVIDPDLYGSAKDPGDVVRDGGARAWQARRDRTDVRHHLEGARPDRTDRRSRQPARPPRRPRPRRRMARRPPAPSRGRADRRAGHGRGDASATTRDAVRRAFRARYWRAAPALEPSREAAVER